ncbi:MAG: hypothetical protein LBB91_02045 [Clostridiales bacterium]|jgi:hypothetical protein|nr:hypothetical protein [Clostridiales bacterium]
MFPKHIAYLMIFLLCLLFLGGCIQEINDLAFVPKEGDSGGISLPDKTKEAKDLPDTLGQEEAGDLTEIPVPGQEEAGDLSEILAQKQDEAGDLPEIDVPRWEEEDLPEIIVPWPDTEPVLAVYIIQNNGKRPEYAAVSSGGELILPFEFGRIELLPDDNSKEVRYLLTNRMKQTKQGNDPDYGDNLENAVLYDLQGREIVAFGSVDPSLSLLGNTLFVDDGNTLRILDLEELAWQFGLKDAGLVAYDEKCFAVSSYTQKQDHEFCSLAFYNYEGDLLKTTEVRNVLFTLKDSTGMPNYIFCDSLDYYVVAIPFDLSEDIFLENEIYSNYFTWPDGSEFFLTSIGSRSRLYDGEFSLVAEYKYRVTDCQPQFLVFEIDEKYQVATYDAEFIGPAYDEIWQNSFGYAANLQQSSFFTAIRKLKYGLTGERYIYHCLDQRGEPVRKFFHSTNNCLGLNTSAQGYTQHIDRVEDGRKTTIYDPKGKKILQNILNDENYIGVDLILVLGGKTYFTARYLNAQQAWRTCLLDENGNILLNDLLWLEPLDSRYFSTARGRYFGIMDIEGKWLYQETGSDDNEVDE